MQGNSRKWVLILLTMFCLGTLPLWAQTAATGGVVGTVSDPSGAVVSGAKVALTDTATGAARTANTNAQGHYVFVNVTPGNYKIEVSKSGFATTTTTQTVQVGLTNTVNMTLQVGQATTTVEVQSTGTELQTLNATVGNTVTGIALQSLPSLGRDVSTFATLQPGVSPDGSVAGTVVDNSSFQLDGGNNTNDMDGSMAVYTTTFAGDPTGGLALKSNPTGVIPTPADSVEEFKVNTANQTADFNSSSGAEVQVATRRGTNAWHGTAYEYYLDNNLDANTWQNNNTKTPLAPYHYSRFGIAGGGPIIPKNVLGGKTYIFANYQGFRWPNSTTYERLVPSADMRAGFLTFDGVRYNAATLDPRGIGINPMVQQMWTKYMPAANDPNCAGVFSRCDGANIQAFKGTIAIPQTDNFGVIRLDHDFGSKWHFNGTYHYYKLIRASTSQVDIGGFFAGDKLGVPTALSARPQVPGLITAGVTTNISSNVTNNFNYSFLRNYWAWGTHGAPPQFPGLGAALEPLGEIGTTSGGPLAPYNVDAQNTRTRFWDGHDNMFRDDVTYLHGNHLIQFGGTYQHNWDYHQRTDNGGGINYYPVYQLGTSSGSGIDLSSVAIPAGVSSSEFGREFAAMLGIVSVSQTAYTRTGNNLALNPPLTPAFDQSTIPFYNLYVSDSWHMRPSLTLTYGLGWTLELPPVESVGKQVSVVDANGNPLDAIQYLNNRKAAALQGQVYNPTIGFALLPNVNGHPKYPYDPYYKEFSPRVAVAWNPDFSKNTVVRGGYGRIYGRLNGVDLVLVPLLGTGLIQAVQCFGPTIGGTCAGKGAATPLNAFRVGIDGLVAPLPAASPTLPQPDFPGINAIAAGAGEGLDPHFRPNVTDTFTFSVQHQLSNKITMEVGYIGRLIHNEYQPININAVPYMMTKGGQTFAKAYAGLEVALGCNVSVAMCGANVPTSTAGMTAFVNSLPRQPFFEAAMLPSYCAGFSSCTAAVAFNEMSNLTIQDVWHMYSDLDAGGFNFPRSMMNTAIPGSPFGASGQLSSGVGMNASIGHGNYNAGFVSLKSSNWHGITSQQNFTWSKSLGTGAVVQATSEYTTDDPFNLDAMYGVQPFDRKFIYNAFLVYEPPFFKSRSGFLGHVLGGWTFAPIFTAGSGEPMQIYTPNGSATAWGEGDGVDFFSNETAMFNGPTPSASLHYNTLGTVAGTSGYGLNAFANPDAVWATVRSPILGLDTRNGGFGVMRGFPYWNMDMSIKKNIKFTERISAEAQVVFTNVLNHFQPMDPNGYFTNTGNLDASNPASFGTVGGSYDTTSPRQMEFGFRVNF